MLRVGWPAAQNTTHAQLWRVLYISGIAKSNREARAWLKSGYISVDGNPIYSMRHVVKIGSPFSLEVTFPSGRRSTQQIVVVPLTFLPKKPRQTGPTTRFHKP